MRKVFSLTNKYIVLATPLILYTLFSSVYLAVASSGGKILNLIFAFALFLLMTGAFIAGWFYMIKTAISEPEKEDPNSLFKEFFSGVGEYFLPSVGSIFVILVISTLMLMLSYTIGLQKIGDPGVSAEALSNALQNSSALKAFMLSLTKEQLIKINLWNILILGTMTLNSFLFILYIPTLFYKNKNPFFAFFISLKDLFSKHILKTLGIFLLILVLNFIISILSTVFATNTIIHFSITLLNFYFIVLIGVGIFYYYYKTFIENKIGQNIDIEV